MNKIKILSLLLCFALLVGILAPGAFALEAKADDTTEDSGTTAEGIEVNKTAAVDEDGNYTITLEAYATGSKVITSESKDMPTDIVLVLDQSGSMGHCIVCGQEMGGYYDYHYTYKYTEEKQISTNNTYYIKNGSSYFAVSHCTGSHNSIFGSYQCVGGEGWYTSGQLSDHTPDAMITPKTNGNPDGTQFYTRTPSGRAECTSRLSALTDAATTFVNNVVNKAKNGNIEHRIAVVGFANSSTAYTGLLDMRNDEKANQVKRVIQKLNAGGGTQVDDGIRTANSIFEANLINPTERNRVVIVFTDGAPGEYGDWCSESVSTANSAIDEAYKAKNTYGATVYSVGVFSGADASNPGSLPSYTNYTIDYWGEHEPSDANQIKNSNRFMHLVSSNYLEATSITSSGTINPKLNGTSYYLSAGDAESLNTIFQKISEQIESGGSSTTLGRETVIKDIVAPAFDMPKNPTDIKVYTADSEGSTDKWKARVPFTEGTVTPDTENSTISVSGFSFKDNWCGKETTNNNESFHDGKKLIIEFTVTPKDGFLGGNNVFTNTSAGIYENSSATEPVKTFPWPQVNVPIKDVTVTAQDKNVYLLGSLTAEQIKDGAIVKCGDVTLDLTKADQNYGLEIWQTEYVDITVEIKDEDGYAIPADGLNDLREDTTYTVSVTVAPKNNGTNADGTPATAKSGVNKPPAKINVFKPVLTYKDSEVYYGDNAPTDFSANKTPEVWKHGETLSTGNGVTMIGDKPTLDITYTPESDKIVDGKISTKQDIAVDATVKINNTDVTSYTRFQHTNCEGKTCTVPNDKEFLLHVKTCQLTITKEGGAVGEPYVFTVKKGDAKYSEVTINGNGSVTIYELPVGTYTIEEDEGWSWRYTGDNGSNAILSAQNYTGFITCTNSNPKPYWLNGYSAVKKNVYGTANN